MDMRLQRIEGLLSELSVLSALPLMLIDPQDGTIVWRNHAACELDLMSPIRALSRGEPTQGRRSDKLEILDLGLGEMWLGRCHLLSSSGRIVVARIYARALELDGRRLIGAQLVDLTDDTGKLEELAWAKRRLEVLVSATFDAIFDWEVESQRIEFSPQINQLLGLADHDSTWRVDEWLELVHPDDRELAMAVARASIQEVCPYETEFRLRRTDGSYILIQERGIVIGGTHVVGADRDITQERMAERAIRDEAELYRTLFYGTANPTWRITQDGRYIDANSAGLSFLEVDKTLLENLHVADHLGVLWDVTTDSWKGEVNVSGSSPHEVAVNVNGKIKHLILSVVLCDVGEAATYFALGTEVTEIRELNDELTSSRDTLREQKRALEERSIALRAIMDQREEDRLGLRRTVEANMQMLVLPTLDRLRHSLSGRPEATHIEVLREMLREIVNRLAPSIDLDRSLIGQLTEREFEILTLIRAGMTSAQIAASLYVSPATVASHRASLRKKLGPAVRGRQLRRHIASLTLATETGSEGPSTSPEDGGNTVSPPVGL